MRAKLLAVADESRAHGVTAVHAHFAYENADAAELLGQALGVGHSVTVHAHDIFVERRHLSRRLQAAARIVTVCEYNARHLIAAYPTCEGRIVVIPCSTRVDDDPSGPSAGSSGQTDAGGRGSVAALHDPVRLLAVGRLVPKKGLDTVLRAVAAMKTNARLRIVGDGPDRAALGRLATALGLDGRVEFSGSLDHASTKAAFREADVFTLAFRVAPDGDRDSMPVVVKEAMAAGVPVVTTREVGVPEMVDDGISGLLVPPDDPDALAAALDRVAGDAAFARQLGERGRATVAERFDLRAQARALRRFFDE